MIYRDVKLKEAQKSLAEKEVYWFKMTTRIFFHFFWTQTIDAKSQLKEFFGESSLSRPWHTVYSKNLPSQ